MVASSIEAIPFGVRVQDQGSGQGPVRGQVQVRVREIVVDSIIY